MKNQVFILSCASSRPKIFPFSCSHCAILSYLRSQFGCRHWQIWSSLIFLFFFFLACLPRHVLLVLLVSPVWATESFLSGFLPPPQISLCPGFDFGYCQVARSLVCPEGCFSSFRHGIWFSGARDSVPIHFSVFCCQESAPAAASLGSWYRFSHRCLVYAHGFYSSQVTAPVPGLRSSSHHPWAVPFGPCCFLRSLGFKGSHSRFFLPVIVGLSFWLRRCGSILLLAGLIWCFSCSEVPAAVFFQR
jgi:hypothetical protein